MPYRSNPGLSIYETPISISLLKHYFSELQAQSIFDPNPALAGLVVTMLRVICYYATR